MALEFLVNRLQALFVLLLGAFRRAMCCLRRRRRSSCDSIPLSAVGVVPNVANKSPETEQWDQWDENLVVVVSDKPSNLVQTKIEQYRQQVAKPPEPQEKEQQLNFFQDMTPKITRQTKVVVRDKSAEQSSRDPSKFAVATERVPTNELEVWEDNATSWEEETLEEFGDPTEALREQRRRERERRLFEQQQKRMEYNFRPQPLGEKIGS